MPLRVSWGWEKMAAEDVEPFEREAEWTGKVKPEEGDF